MFMTGWYAAPRAMGEPHAVAVRWVTFGWAAFRTATNLPYISATNISCHSCLGTAGPITSSSAQARDASCLHTVLQTHFLVPFLALLYRASINSMENLNIELCKVSELDVRQVLKNKTGSVGRAEHITLWACHSRIFMVVTGHDGT